MHAFERFGEMRCVDEAYVESDFKRCRPRLCLHAAKEEGHLLFSGQWPGQDGQYHFNQDILPVGAAYWVVLTESYLH